MRGRTLEMLLAAIAGSILPAQEGGLHTGLTMEFKVAEILETAAEQGWDDIVTTGKDKAKSSASSSANCAAASSATPSAAASNSAEERKPPAAPTPSASSPNRCGRRFSHYVDDSWTISLISDS